MPTQLTYRQMLMVLLSVVNTLKDQHVILPRARADFVLKSNNFRYGDILSKKFTPYGKNVNPELHWDGIPKDTRSFALIVDDPDAPNGVFTHWVVKNIPGDVRQIKMNSVPGELVKNSWGIMDYKGPQPPQGQQHRYYFTLYAIRESELRARTLKALRIEINAKKTGEAVLMGKYP